MIIGGLNSLLSSGLTNAEPNGTDVPGTLSGLILWLRGDSVVSPVNGQKFTTWNDLSPLAATYSQSSSADQFVWNASDPIFGGQPSVTGTNNTNMDMNVNNAPQVLPQTIYVVFSTTLPQTYQIFLSGFPDSAECGIQNGYVYTYNGVSHYGSADQFSAGKAHLACYILGSANGSTQCFLDDGYAPLALVSGLGACSNYDLGMYLGYEGQADGLIGNFAEIISYVGAHTYAQRQVIFNYLAQRYSQPQWTTFSPYDLQPSAWFRSDLGITLNGSTVSGWADQSGNGYNLGNSTAAYQPTYSATGGVNGLPKLTFTYGSHVALFNSSFTQATSPTEIFVVATSNTNVPGTNAAIVDLGNQNNIVLQTAGTDTLELYNGSALDYNASFSIGTPFIADCCNTGSSSSFINMNGGTPVTGSAGTAAQSGSNITVGNYNQGAVSGNGFGGDIMEVIVFDYVLSSAARTQVLNYLSARYGIAV